MKTYVLSALSVMAFIGLAFATPVTGNAAGFGAAAGVGKALTPTVNLTAGCASSIEPEHKIWLAAGGCGGTTGGGGGGSGNTGGSGKGGLQSAPQP